MAYSTINKSSEHFNTKLYTGNGSAGNAVTGVGFAPNMVWIKERSSTSSHTISDTVRGAGKRVNPNYTNAEETLTHLMTSFDSDGFTNGADNGVNESGQTYVSWNWKAGTTGSGTTTGAGVGKAYSYSCNTTAGFSIIKYTGNATAGHTIPHHLGATPSFIMVKNMDRSSGAQWSVYHKESFESQSSPKVLYLNTTGGGANDVNVWGNSSVTIDSTVFSLGDYSGTNATNENMIAYAFTDIPGYSKAGSYIGNGNVNGPFIYTGFKPAFVLGKKSSGVEDWFLFDNARDTHNTNYKLLYANADNAEYTGVTSRNDFLSNGFKMRTTDGKENQNGEKYVYMAFGQSIVGSNNVPATAR